MISFSVGVVIKRMKSLSVTNTLITRPLRTEVTHNRFLSVGKFLRTSRTTTNWTYPLFLHNLIKYALIIINKNRLRNSL